MDGLTTMPYLAHRDPYHRLYVRLKDCFSARCADVLRKIVLNGQR